MIPPVLTYQTHLRRVLYMSHYKRKLFFGVSDQVGHKPACAAIEDGSKLNISDLGRVLYKSRDKRKPVDEVSDQV